MKERIEFLPIKSISLPAVNPRPKESLDNNALQDLARSIQQKGVLVPILVRPIDDLNFELVAGQRRLLACRSLEHETIPALVREMDATEALQLAITENLQRADLHYLDEAQAFADLQSRAKMDPDAIAQRLGKGPSYIRQRLALVNLIPEFKRRAREGQLSVMGAVQLARISINSQKLVRQELNWELRRGEVLTAGRIRGILNQLFYHRLDVAPFGLDDARLVPKAGSCTTCPKSSAAAPALFADIAQDATCTDASCFRMKCEAHALAAEKAAGSGTVRISLGNPFASQDYIEKNKIICEDRWQAGPQPSWRPAKGEACDSTKRGVVFAAENPRDIGRVIKICTDTRCPLHSSLTPREGIKKIPGVLPEWRKKQIQKQWEMRTEKAVRMELHDAVRLAAGALDVSGLPVGLLKFLADRMLTISLPRKAGARRLMDLYGKVGVDGVMDAIENCARKADLLLATLDVLLADAVADPQTDGDLILKASAALGIDAEQIRAPIQAKFADLEKASAARRQARLAKERAKAQAAKGKGTQAKRGPRAASKKKGGPK